MALFWSPEADWRPKGHPKHPKHHFHRFGLPLWSPQGSFLSILGSHFGSPRAKAPPRTTTYQLWVPILSRLGPHTKRYVEKLPRICHEPAKNLPRPCQNTNRRQQHAEHSPPTTKAYQARITGAAVCTPHGVFNNKNTLKNHTENRTRKKHPQRRPFMLNY